MIGLFYGSVVDKKYETIIKYTIETLYDIFGENLILFDKFKTDKLTKLIDRKLNIIKVDLRDAKSFEDYHMICQNIIKKNKIDVCIFFRTPIVKTFKEGNIDLIKQYQKNKGCFNFVTGRNLLLNYIFLVEMKKKCKNFIQIFTDVQEVDFQKVINFEKATKAYLANFQDFKFVPCYEFGLLTSKKSNYTKTIDFSFYCTALTEDRAYLKKKKQVLEEKFEYVKIIVDTKKERDAFLTQSEYHNLLSKSKYTLCVPAYDKNNFSIWRIFEAIRVDCLCFVYDKCDLSDVKNTHKEIYSIIKKYLLVKSFEDITKKINELPENDRQLIINMIKETNDYKALLDLKKIKEVWKEITNYA